MATATMTDQEHSQSEDLAYSDDLDERMTQIEQEIAEVRRRLRERHPDVKQTVAMSQAIQDKHRDWLKEVFDRAESFINALPPEMQPVLTNSRFMTLCPQCGNKRCPRASSAMHKCTGSNEPGQPGSNYP